MLPGFLQYAKGKKYDTKEDITSLRAKMAISGLDKFITNKMYTPIDLMSLWDKCMLHEMMHTKPGGTKDDVGGFSGYGWKNCKAMANDKGKNNADSYALFGSAMFYASQGSPVDADGKFTASALKSNSKRWLGGRVAQGIDIVKRDAVKQFM